MRLGLRRCAERLLNLEPVWMPNDWTSLGTSIGEMLCLPRSPFDEGCGNP